MAILPMSSPIGSDFQFSAVARATMRLKTSSPSKCWSWSWIEPAAPASADAPSRLMTPTDERRRKSRRVIVELFPGGPPVDFDFGIFIQGAVGAAVGIQADE